MSLLALGVAALCGCDKLGVGAGPSASTQRPPPEALHRIEYMSRATSRDGDKLFDHPEQARSCSDLELAMRWNRPPDMVGGSFNKKLIYLAQGVPPDLPRQAEVFLTAVIVRGESLPSGGWGWSLAMRDGSEVQAIEAAEYWQKQEQAQQEGSPAAIVKPSTPGRTLCLHGIYQGLIGKSARQTANIPLVSVLFALDRDG